MRAASQWTWFFLFLGFHLCQNVELPHTETLAVAPGTTFGFEFSETPPPGSEATEGTIDCVQYSFESDKPISAQLFFRTWNFLVGLVVNGTGLPQEGAAPGTLCDNVTSCEIFFNGTEPIAEDSDPTTGLPVIPHTVVFWYGVDEIGDANLTYTVDAPCYDLDTPAVEATVDDSA